MKKFILQLLCGLIVLAILGFASIVQYPKESKWEQDRLESYLCSINNDCD